MGDNITPNKPIEGLIADNQVSFNFERPEFTYNRFPRRVTIIPISGAVCLVVPGLEPKKEPSLVSKLKRTQNWKTITKHAYEIPPDFFSFPWRFSVYEDWRRIQLRALNAFGLKETKKIRLSYKKYQAALLEKLVPGQVFLVPDKEVTFQQKHRFKQIYARYVLVVHSRSDELVFMPFSTKIERMNPDLDILFDATELSGSLDMKARPAVENFPYQIFRRKTALVVSAAQPMVRQRFLQVALVPVGAVRRELLGFAQLKLKKI